MKPKLLMQSFLFLALTASLMAPAAHGKLAWVEWPDNPVISPSTDVYYPSVLYDPLRFSDQGDAAAYKMWADPDLQYFVSENGIDWTLIDTVAVGLEGPVRHPLVEYYPDGFAGVNSGSNPSGGAMFYRLWYWNQSFLTDIRAIHYAESPDGKDWFNNQPIAQNQDYPDAPLTITGDTDDWNAGSYGPADVLFNPDAANSGTDWVFTMYYDGTDEGDESLGIAFSEDGIHWIGYDGDDDGKADPILAGGGGDDWDGGEKGYVSRATVIKVKKHYHMWYSGGVTDMNDGIGYAVSRDGITWKKSSGNPIFHIDDGVLWRTERTYTPMVVYDRSAFCGHGQTYRFKMWFSGKSVGVSPKSVGYAVGGNSRRNCFDIRKARLIRSKNHGDDRLDLVRAVFHAEMPDPDAPVIFALDDRVLVSARFDDFTVANDTYIYRYSEAGGPSVRLKLNFEKGLWRLTVKDVDLSDLGPAVSYSLQVGAFMGSLRLQMREKKKGLYYP